MFKTVSLPGAYLGALAMVAVLVCSFAWSMHLSLIVPDKIIRIENVWYGADLGRVFDNMTDINSNHYRTKVHPIFSFLILPPTQVLSELLGNQPLLAIKILISVFSSLTVGFVFLFVKMRTGSLLQAVLASVLLASSSSYMFWSSVPETFSVGGMSIMFAFMFLLLPNVTNLQLAGINAFSLSFTTTNWMSALLVTYCRRQPGQASMIAVAGFLLVAVAAVWQGVFIPSSQFFFLPAALMEEPAYLVVPWGENDLLLYVQRILSYLVYGIVAPTAEYQQQLVSGFLSYGIIGWIAVVLWSVILSYGIVALLMQKDRSRFAIPLLFFLFSQAVLHIVYGDEPFLYSAHFVPVLVLVSAFCFDLGKRRLLSGVYVALIFLAAYSNYLHFHHALSLVANL